MELKRIGVIGLGGMLIALLNGDCLHAQTEQAIERYVAMQEHKTKNRSDKGYWSFSLLGGTVTYFAEKDVAERGRWEDGFTPCGKIAVARWFSSVFGLRWQTDGGKLHNTFVKEEEASNKGQFYFVSSYIEAITNVLNWGRVKNSNRPVSIYLYAGGGLAWTPERTCAPAQFSPTALVGGEINIRMTDYWSFSFEIDGTIVKDNFNNHTGGRIYEGFSGASLGLTYRIW